MSNVLRAAAYIRAGHITAVFATASLSVLSLSAASHVQAAGPSGRRQASPSSPIRVYVGGQQIASGQSLSRAISAVRGRVPFTIGSPGYVPARYVAVSLFVTPQQRDVSKGFSTLSYAFSAGKNSYGPAAFAIDQGASPLTFVAGSGVVSATIGAYSGTLREFRTPGHDLLILSWTEGTNGYDITTDAAISHLSTPTLTRIATSLR